MTKEEEMKQIAKNIKILRESFGYTPKEVAIDLDIDYKTYNKYERGVLHIPDSNLEKICNHYGFNIGVVKKDLYMLQLPFFKDLISPDNKVFMDFIIKLVSLTTTEKAKEDQDFMKAYNTYYDFYSIEDNHNEKGRDCLKRSMKQFLKSYENNKTIESAINYVRVFFVDIYVEMYSSRKDIDNSHIDFINTTRSIINNELDGTSKELSQYIIDQEEKLIIPMIKEIKTNGYYDLGEILNITRYVSIFLDDPEENRKRIETGESLIHEAYYSKNKYIVKYIDLFEKLDNKNN